VAKRYRYTGKERDEETGLYYHGARYYMPWLVRWMAVDPLQYKNIFISSYVYCSGNPVSRVDDDGMDDKVKTEISTLKDTQVGRTVDDRQVLVEKGSTIMTSNAKEGGGTTLPYIVAIEQQGKLYLWNNEHNWFSTNKGEDYSNPGLQGLAIDITNVVERQMKATFRNPIPDLERSFSKFAQEHPYLGANTVPLFVGNQVAESLKEWGGNVVAGGQRSKEAVISGFQFLRGVSQTGFMMPSAKSNFFFRGTSAGYEGNPSLLRAVATPTSTNPAIATLFATESERYGSGVLHIASSSELKGVTTTANVLQGIEKEVVFDMLPSEFAQKAGVTITAAESRSILKEMGVNIPSNVTKENLSSLALSMPNMSQFDINYFVTKALFLRK